MSDIYDPAFPTCEDTAKKSTKLQDQSAKKSDSVGKLSEVVPDLYDGVCLEIIEKTPSKGESVAMSPQSDTKKETPSNGLILGSGKPKHAQDKNLPIYEEEDFDSPVTERANLVQSTKWDNLGITPLIKTDLYKDILETLPEAKSEIKQQKIQLTVPSPTTTLITENDSTKIEEIISPVHNPWNNLGATPLIANDLYEDIIDTDTSVVSKTDSQNSSQGQCCISEPLVEIINSDIPIVPFCQQNASNDTSPCNIQATDSIPIEHKHEQINCNEGLICALACSPKSESVLESTIEPDQDKEEILQSPIPDNCIVAINESIKNEFVKTLKVVENKAENYNDGLLNMEFVQIVHSKSTTCTSHDEKMNLECNDNPVLFEMESVELASTCTLASGLENEGELPKSPFKENSENEKVLPSQHGFPPLLIVHVHPVECLPEDSVPVVSPDLKVVESNFSTSSETRNNNSEVESKNSSLESLPASDQVGCKVQTDNSETDNDTSTKKIPPKDELQSDVSQGIVVHVTEIEIEESGFQDVLVDDGVLECEKEGLTQSEVIIPPDSAQKHLGNVEAIDFRDVSSNFEVVPNEVQTEIVLSDLPEEISNDVQIDINIINNPVLSQSDRFYRKYIPSEGTSCSPNYDLHEPYNSSLTMDSEVDNANHASLNSEDSNIANQSQETAFKNSSQIINSKDSQSPNLEKIDTQLNQYVPSSFNDNFCESSSLKNVSDESQTSDSSSLISQKENLQSSGSRLSTDYAESQIVAETSESSETKESSSSKERPVKKKYKKSDSSVVHGSSSEGSGSPATEDQPVRRSSRIKSLEEKREKQREFNRKKDGTSKHKKLQALKKASSLGTLVTGLEPINEDANLNSKESSSASTNENKNADSNSLNNAETTSPFLDASSISPITDPRRNPADDDSRRPEKVKSRWRRSSEMERVHTNSPLILPLKLLNNNCHSLNHLDQQDIPANSDPNSTITIKDEFKLEKDKMPHFEPIEENIFLFERKKSKSKREVRRMACDCTLTKEERDEGYMGCLDDCLNRLLMIECGSRCILGDLCANKRFMKKENANCAAFKTEKKGWGLKALEPMESGTFIMEYVGEILSSQEFKQRVKLYSREKVEHYFFMALKGDEIIDATLKGNISRFINHSCDPNCETQKWTVNGELRIGFFTKKIIKENEELTFDYQFQRYGREAQKCFCEALNCRGYIGEERKMSLEKPGKTIIVPKKKRTTTNTVVEEKKKEEPEDLALEKELEKLCSIGGLKNREQTLMLNRLMVRADSLATRQRLLDIIQNTKEQACLRLFLDYHGLTLLWSWMVDLGEEAVELKKQILEILALLPITNKTVLLDSKVLSVVQKWAIQDVVKIEKPEGPESVIISKEAETSELSSGTPSDIETPILTDIQVESSTNSMSIKESNADVNVINEPPLKKPKLDTCSDVDTIKNEETITETKIVEETKLSCKTEPIAPWPSIDDDFMESEDICLSDIVVGQVIKKLMNDVCQISQNDRHTESAIAKEGENQDSELSKVNENAEDTEPSNEITEPKIKIDIPSMVASLLESWSNLKEVFRIPRLEHQKRKQDELAASSVLQDRERDFYDSPTRRKDYERDYSRSRDYDKRRDRSPRAKDFDDGHEPKPKKFMVAPVTTGPKLSKEERRQLFELEVQQRDHEEALRKQAYLAQVQAMEMAAAPPVQQEFLIPTVFDSCEPVCGPHPDYVGQPDYGRPRDYPIEFPGQIDYVMGEYVGGPLDYTEGNEFTGLPPDYATQSYVFDPTTGTYVFDPTIPYAVEPNSLGIDFPEPPSTLIPVYPPPSSDIQPIVSFISTMVSSSNASQSKDSSDEQDELDDEECESYTMQPIKPSLLRATPSSPAPKPISPYPSPLEGQSPADFDSLDISFVDYHLSPAITPVLTDIPSPSQIPLPSSPAPNNMVEISSPQIASPVLLRTSFSVEMREQSEFQSPQHTSSPLSEVSPVTISSPVQIASPLQATTTTLPRPVVSTLPLLSLVSLPLLPAIPLSCASTPTPEQTPEQNEVCQDTTALASPIISTINYDSPSLIQSLLQKVAEASSPASPLNFSHPIISPVPSVSTPQISSPVSDLMSPLAINQSSSIAANAASFVPGQTSFLPVGTQGGPLYYVQPSGAVMTIPEQSLAGVTGAVPLVHVAMAPQALDETLALPAPEKPKRYKLPPNWKTAKDGEGNIYYYHSGTRQTQWDPPEGSVEEDELPMEVETPTYEETPFITIKHSKRRTTTAAADTSSELAKRIKEMFRSKMSSYIVQCLNPYRKPECKVGRITNTDDFKHLARKLTHFVMAKELKHCKNVDDLECNENVKHKAKDFVFKYMNKFGSEFKKEKTLSPRDF